MYTRWRAGVRQVSGNEIRRCEIPLFRLHAGGRAVKVHRMTAAEPTTDGSYRDRIVAVEPGGNEFIAEADRHGRPSQLLWTWASPNLEFATIFLGVLAVSYFGMTFWQAVAGIVIGAGLGAAAHSFLSARGPQLGVPQMVIGRLSFGYRGNAVPSTLMAITAGVGWFATNSISAAFALATLFGIAPVWALVLVVIVQTALAFFGHNLVQAFERWAFPVLAVIFAITAVVIMSKADLGAPAVEGGVGGVGGFLLTVGATFGYVAGWTPYAADFSRYLPSTVSPARTGLFAAGGLFLASSVLAIVGAASVTIITNASSDNPADVFTSSLPGALAAATLLAIAIGAVAANAINVYSAGMAFVTTGVKLPAHIARATATVFFGIAGFLVAWWALADAAASYEAFLLLIAYWVGPWLGVVFADQYLRRGQRVDGFLYDHSYSNWPGLLSFLIGLVVSFLLFCNQELFVGFVVRAVPDLGDIGFFVGFLLAAGSYLVLCRAKIAAERVPA
ncbi:NCS1 nucleoside transporter family [Mycolicibacterium neoaurum]|uniref:Cytosine/purines uracil thiamine allantoin permease n=2 Tax=Mycolicibacterium neoaurum TaxID=1795 RepID=A0AAV2WQV7_MYCNE|nr:cytosine/purines uracil thiamine allantoin permease [Mycolicibacterium neoaurum]SDD55428.1 NCS1 nucleoside transporter family [Mycolicibacterium neoaurum]